MVLRLSLLAGVGALVLACEAHAANTQVADNGFAISGLASDSRVVAEELCPLDAYVITLDGASTVIYYTYDEGGEDAIRVVTTIGTDPDGAAAPVRFVNHLPTGQKAEVSVVGAAGAKPAVLEFAYDGERLTVRTITDQPET